MVNTKALTLIPAWNEVDFIAPIISATVSNYPVLVVDDGSTDSTPQIAADLGATVVSHKENMGKGIALQTGFKWAIDNDYDVVITLDADGQHDPLEIPKFLEEYEQSGADLIIGRRNFRPETESRWECCECRTWLPSYLCCWGDCQPQQPRVAAAGPQRPAVP